MKQDPPYKIVFSGGLQANVRAEDAIGQLARKFKLSEDEARVLLLDGRRHVLKKGVDRETAERYREALESVGLLVQVEPMEPQAAHLSLAPLEGEQSESGRAPDSSDDGICCPKCGSNRVENGVCRDCGVVSEKYLSRQADTQRPEARHATTKAAPVNPYEAPMADLTAKPRPGGVEGITGPSTVPIGHGWAWITRGFWHFTTNPLAWILAILVFIGLSMVMALIPFIGGILTTIMGPVFSGGLMLGAKAQDRGADFRLEHLFAGFSNNGGQLALVGLLYLVGTLIVAALVGIFIAGSIAPMMLEIDPTMIGGEDPQQAVNLMGPSMMLAIFVTTLLFIPLMMALFFAPALVALNGMSAIAAMRLSFFGCVKNLLPLLVYGISALALTVLAIIPLGLGLLVLWPTLLGAMYVAYRDIFFD